MFPVPLMARIREANCIDSRRGNFPAGLTVFGVGTLARWGPSDAQFAAISELGRVPDLKRQRGRLELTVCLGYD